VENAFSLLWDFRRWLTLVRPAAEIFCGCRYLPKRFSTGNSGVMLQPMSNRKRQGSENKNGKSERVTSLRSLCDYLKLSPATVSVVINDSPAAKAIPQRTKDRILDAAQKLNYRPNFFARSLSLQRGLRRSHHERYRRSIVKGGLLLFCG
jgi:hypothetical protein